MMKERNRPVLNFDVSIYRNNLIQNLLLTNDISLVGLIPINIQLFIVDYIYYLFAIT